VIKTQKKKRKYGMEVKASWCQQKNWHHLPYMTHIATLCSLRLRH